ncbi:hypothetical protein A2U01_0099374, partial [Trifolium medium]|nr:hypothetical protein [Trifolium medium]
MSTATSIATIAESTTTTAEISTTSSFIGELALSTTSPIGKRRLNLHSK